MPHIYDNRISRKKAPLQRRGTSSWRKVLPLAAVMAMATFGPAAAADLALVEAARSEGALTVYYCDSSLKDTIEGFTALYPEISLTTYVTGCWQVYNRYHSERTAGRPVAGVFMGTEDVLRQLQSDGSLEDYASPEREFFPDSAKPEGAFFTMVKTIIFGQTFNESFAGEMPAPKDWLDFANPPPEWQGAVSFFDPRSSSTAFLLLATLHENLGPEKTASIYKGMMASGAELSPNTSAGIAKLLTGEKPIMFYILNNHYLANLEKGAPLTFTVPTSGTVAMPFGITVLNDAPQLNAARLFTDYMLNEGQQKIAEGGEYALREGVPQPTNLPPLQGLKTLPLDIEKALADQPALIEWWQNETGIR